MKKTKTLYKILFLAGTIILGYLVLPVSRSALSASSDFILTWSANSYIPQTYEGRALPIRGSTITVFALPVKKLAQNPDFLYYRWLLDDDVVGWANGIGKTSFVFAAEKWAGDFHKIGLQILDSSRQVTLFQGSVYVKIVSPEILISNPDNSRYSIVETLKAATGKKIKLTAWPFFFNIRRITDMDFSWQIDGQELSGEENSDPNLLNLTIPEGNLSQTVYKNLYLLAFPKNNEREQDSINLSVEIR